MPEKTRRQTSCSMSVFNSWCEVRKESSDIVRMDPATIESDYARLATIQEKLCRFVMEARRLGWGMLPAKQSVRDCHWHPAVSS